MESHVNQSIIEVLGRQPCYSQFLAELINAKNAALASQKAVPSGNPAEDEIVAQKVEEIVARIADLYALLSAECYYISTTTTGKKN